MAIDAIDSVLCNGCGICVRNCPMDVIRMDKGNKKTYIKYAEDCMLCGVCLECPQKSIHLVPGFNRPIILGWGSLRCVAIERLSSGILRTVCCVDGA